MRKFKYVLVAALLVPVMLFFAACGKKDDSDKSKNPDDSVVTLTSSHISIPNSTYYYTGEEITPEVTVTVDGKTIASSNYLVSYSNNIEIGTATITVTANSSSTIISGSASKTFTIEQKTTHVSTFAELQHAVKTNNIIVLDNDILFASGNETDKTLEIVADESDLKIVIDLNGYTLEKYVLISNFNESNYDTDYSQYYPYSLSVTIQNGTLGNDREIQEGSEIIIAGNESVAVNLDSVDVVNFENCITTEERCYGALLNTYNCSFKTISKTSGSCIESLSHYTLTFDNCKFEGYVAFEIYKGLITLNDGCNAKTISSVIYAETSNDHTLTQKYFDACEIKIYANNGVYESESGYIFEIKNSLNASETASVLVSISTSDLTTYVDGEGASKYYSSDYSDADIVIQNCFSGKKSNKIPNVGVPGNENDKPKDEK